MSQTENIAASAAKLSGSWRDEVNQISTRLNSFRARSCWDRGVNGFALDLLIKAAALVVLTAFACWFLFRYTLRVETVHQENNGYIVEVSVLGRIDAHECN